MKNVPIEIIERNDRATGYTFMYGVPAVIRNKGWEWNNNKGGWGKHAPSHETCAKDIGNAIFNQE